MSDAMRMRSKPQDLIGQTCSSFNGTSLVCKRPEGQLCQLQSSSDHNINGLISQLCVVKALRSVYCKFNLSCTLDYRGWLRESSLHKMHTSDHFLSEDSAERASGG